MPVRKEEEREGGREGGREGELTRHKRLGEDLLPSRGIDVVDEFQERLPLHVLAPLVRLREGGREEGREGGRNGEIRSS
jgi:hypothetical protein